MTSPPRWRQLVRGSVHYVCGCNRGQGEASCHSIPALNSTLLLSFPNSLLSSPQLISMYCDFINKDNALRLALCSEPNPNPKAKRLGDLVKQGGGSVHTLFVAQNNTDGVSNQGSTGHATNTTHIAVGGVPIRQVAKALEKRGIVPSMHGQVAFVWADWVKDS